MKKCLIIFYCFLISALSYAQKDMKNVISRSEQLPDYIGKEAVLEGIMQMKKFVSKAGRETEVYEFYIELEDGVQVLLRNKTGKPLSKEPFTRKVRLQGRLFYGNVDIDVGTPIYAQSRVGYRFDFTSWEIIERR